MDKLHTTESVVHCSYCNAAHTMFPTVKYHSLASIKWLIWQGTWSGMKKLT